MKIVPGQLWVSREQSHRVSYWFAEEKFVLVVGVTSCFGNEFYKSIEILTPTRIWNIGANFLYKYWELHDGTY